MKRGAYSRRDWNDGDNERMIELREQGLSFEEIARRMDRGKETIRVRYYNLFGNTRSSRAWQPEDDTVITDMFKAGSTISQMQQKFPNRSYSAIKDRIYRLGLRDGIMKTPRNREFLRDATPLAIIDAATKSQAAKNSKKLLDAMTSYYVRRAAECGIDWQDVRDLLGGAGYVQMRRAA